jgi:hypothetical protein
MNNVIDGHAYVIVYDDGQIISVETSIYMYQPKDLVPHEYVRIFPSIFIANAFIKANTLGAKVTIQRAA